MHNLQELLRDTALEGFDDILTSGQFTDSGEPVGENEKAIGEMTPFQKGVYTLLMKKKEEVQSSMARFKELQETLITSGKAVEIDPFSIEAFSIGGIMGLAIGIDIPSRSPQYSLREELPEDDEDVNNYRAAKKHIESLTQDGKTLSNLLSNSIEKSHTDFKGCIKGIRAGFVIAGCTCGETCE